MGAEGSKGDEILQITGYCPSGRAWEKSKTEELKWQEEEAWVFRTERLHIKRPEREKMRGRGGAVH